jgi:NADH-quinone oxidoreductase subunit L
MGFLLLYWADIETWLEPVTGYRSGTTPIPGWSLIVITLVVVLLGALFAWMKYGRREVPAVAPTKVSWLTKAARRNLFDDATNDALVVQPTFYLSRLLVWFDTRVIDGIVHGSAALVGGASGRLRRIQTGYARSYALTMVIGLLLIVVAFALVRL